VIVTVTPNPALDLTYSLTDAVGADVDVHRATSSSLEASGKGVNVSRALANAGVATCAVFPAGGAVGRALVELLGDDGVACRVVRQSGETRINTSALSPGGTTVKLNGPGAALTPAEREGLLHETALALEDATDAAQPWVAVCGSLPPGVDAALIADLVALAHRHGAKCAVDASGDALVAAVRAGADLLAPNRFELAEIAPAARAATSIPELAAAAATLCEESAAEMLISLGRDGALFTDGRRMLHGWGPPLVPVNTAGAGDALLSGWLSGRGSAEHRLARAIAWGRSACLAGSTVDPSPGTGDSAELVVRDLADINTVTNSTGLD
jgi:1-phosphofructokinase